MFLKKSDKSNDRHLQKLIISEPRLFARLADKHLQAGEVKKAAKTLVKGLQQFPDSVSGWLVKGMLHLHLKQSKLARAAFEKALTIDPEIPIAHRQSAELAQEEGDMEGYLNHLRALGSLEPLDDNLQIMLQTAILRQTAVSKGLFSQHQVERMMPGTLRQALLRANLLPPEIARRTERFTFPPETSLINESIAIPDVIPLESQPVWKDPKIKEKIARMEEEDRERVVRVAWADAINNPAETPLVEIDAEQLISSGVDENDVAEEDPSYEDSSRIGLESPVSRIESASPSDSVLPASMQKAMIKPYIPPPKLASRQEPISSNLKPFPDMVKETPPRTPPTVMTVIESDWEGATPSLPVTSNRSSYTDENRGVVTNQPPLKRPRLTSDIKLPAMRALDAEDAEIGLSTRVPVRSSPEEFVDKKTVGGAIQPTTKQAPAVIQEKVEIQPAPPQPSLEPLSRKRLFTPPPVEAEREVTEIAEISGKIDAPETPISVSSMVDQPRDSMISGPEPVEQEPVINKSETSRIPRDDSAILRLMQTKKESTASVNAHPTMSNLTRFETPENEDNDHPPYNLAVRPPVKRESTTKSESTLSNLTRFEIPEDFDDDQPPPVRAVPSPREIESLAVRKPVIEIESLEASPVQYVPEQVAPLQEKDSSSKSIAHPIQKPKPQIPVQPRQPSAPPPKVNERLEIIDENVVPMTMRMPTEMPVMPPPPDLAAREEVVRQKLAAIVEEVTGKAPTLETPQAPPATEEKGSDYHLKGKIATKTLAELYASQGDWKRSADVYEILLEKFPTNEAYRKRLEALKSKMDEG